MNKKDWQIISTGKPNQVGYQLINDLFSFLIIQTRSRENLAKTIQFTIFLAKELKTPLSNKLAVGISYDFRLNQTYFFTQDIFIDDNGRIRPVFKAKSLADDDKDIYPNIIGLKTEHPWLIDALKLLKEKLHSSSKLKTKDFYNTLMSLLEQLPIND